jgi:apolipoprotein N-acyltransferase
MLLSVLSAILGILAFLPFDFFWLLGFVFLVPILIFFLKEERFWRLILGAFIFRLIFASGVVYFTLEPITWLSSILIFLGLPIAVYFVKKFLNRFNNYLILNSYFLILSLPFLWTFFDHLEARYSLLPTYIMSAGNVFGSSPFLGLAGVGGLIFLTFFATLINVLIAKIISNAGGFYPPKLNLRIAVIVAAIIFLGWRISHFQLSKNAVAYDNLKDSLKIAVVSANEKFNSAELDGLKNKLNSKQADLIIFPEDILDDFMGQKQTAFLMQKLAQESGTNLIATFDVLQNKKRYNSTVLFNREGEIVDVYNKNRLTFMGEYWPFADWRPFYLNQIKDKPESKNYAVFNPRNSYSAGEKKLLTIRRESALINFVSLICLEVHYPDVLKEYKERGARFIINPTSNRWIGVGVKHFLYLTNNLRRIEAVWLKMPIISSGVKDFAGIIKPDGRIDFVNFENQNKNYGLFFGELKY